MISRRDFLSLGAAAPMLAPAMAVAADMRKQMKITAVKTDLLRFAPAARNYSDAIHTFGPDRGGVVVRVETDAGHTGWAYSSFGMVGGGPAVLRALIEEELKPVLVGQDPTMIRKLRAALWNATEYHGVQGMTQFAIGAVDIALWDILGKAANLPVYKLLGAHHDRMPVYNMCGWYYDDDRDLGHYKKALTGALEEGFRAVKIKTGRGTVEEDVARIRAAQAVCGKDVRIMVDANQGLRLNEAIRRGREYQALGCFWYEEPLPPHEKDGYSELAAALDIRIATGENEYTKYAFHELLKRKAADVVQPDNRRAGGVTEWMEISALAEAHGVEIASHGGGTTNLHMLLAMPNAIYMETGSIKGDTSHVEALRMEGGAVLVPEMPGMGSALKEEYIRKNRVA